MSADTTTENATDPVVRPASRLRGLSPYAPPDASPTVDLSLDANEGPTQDGAVFGALRELTAEDLRRYPDASALESKIAGRFGVAPSRVVVTAGGDDAIDRVCRCVLEPGRDLLVHAPSFEMIERGARLAGAGVRTVEWLGGAFPARSFVERIDPGVGLVALVSPDNPTGGVIERATMARVAESAREVGALVLVDLAYVEFADEDPTAELLDEPNVVIVRTFSKSMGLAGCRAGYAIAPEGVARWLRTVGGPYPVSSLSLAIAGSAIDRSRDRRATVERVRSERRVLTDDLRSMGCGVLESQANFVTARFRDSAFVHAALRSLGISVRRFTSRPVLDGYLRVTLPGDASAFARLRGALRAAVAPEALLLDLDGVIADVRDSYRRAIVETARAFGATVTRADVDRAKRAGDANNDWELTRRMIESHGITCSTADVTKRFQSIYEGSNGDPGLRERETIIPDAGVIGRLAGTRPLAIVTGRPRAEAEWFLRRAEISGLFGAIVCMEDAPPKPAKDPVELAMDRLGVRTSWMVGDTPDDIVAARRAGVVPVGIPSPGDRTDETRGALRDAGAARVIETLDELEEMLR